MAILDELRAALSDDDQARDLTEIVRPDLAAYLDLLRDRTGEPTTQLDLIPIPDKLLEGFDEEERGTMRDAWRMTNDPALVEAINLARRSGEPVDVEIDGIKITVEPALRDFGMSRFGENGFLLGRASIQGDRADIGATIAHEIFRLRRSDSQRLGISAELARQETAEARTFSDRVEFRVFRAMLNQGGR